jgi:hypothetical protein
MYWLDVAMLALAMSALAPAARAADKRPPARVYVFAAHSTGNGVSDEEQGLEDSARDLRDALRGRAEFVLVATLDEAQLRVEVVNREERDVPVGGFGGTALTRFRETIVRLRVETADEKAELKGIGRPSWKSAAKDAADRLTKWVKSHQTAGSPAPGS